MCIITGPVTSVNSTKIFVAPSRSRNRQLTVYSNVVDTSAQNMMILPVPNPTTVEFEEGVMHYKTLFKDTDTSFYNPYEYTRSLRSATATPLPIYDVGSYQASIANSVADLSRLDTNTFQISSDLSQVLSRHYESGPFGFVCCILKPGGNKYEPIAYTHMRLNPQQLFVPTRHFHATRAPIPAVNSPYRGVMAALLDVDNEYADDWDHEIYSVGTVPTSAHRNQEEAYLPTERNHLNWGNFPPEYQYTPGHRLCRWGMKGHGPNRDLVFEIAVTP